MDRLAPMFVIVILLVVARVLVIGEDTPVATPSDLENGMPGAGTASPVPRPPPSTPTIDAVTREDLTISPGPSVDARPGETVAFTLGTFECCVIFQELPVQARWSVTPSNGARIDPAGVLTVEEDAPHGSVFEVRAEVEGGQQELTATVHVYTPEANPLVGTWREEAQFDCDTGAEIGPTNPIGELRFRADGTFTVTWQPFEVYVDYWGSYTYDLARGTLDLSLTGGNIAPVDPDWSGTFALDAQGRLLLTDMWLGSPPREPHPANCGHRFA